MINLELLRKNNKNFIDSIKRKDPSFDAENLVLLDLDLRKVRQDLEIARSRKNELASLGKSGVTEELKQESRDIGLKIKDLESKFDEISKSFNDLYLLCPNLLFEDVPNGNKESNLVVSQFKEKPEFDFEPKNHVDLGKINDWFDFEAATRMTSSNFAFYKNGAVNLFYSLMMFMLKNNIKHGYSPVIPPYLVNEKALEGSGNFPRFKDEAYDISQDGLYLTPTSEVNLTNIYKNHIFDVDALPIRMASWTSCFRREAGNYGASERGLIRIHQFEKVEIYTICTPENSEQEQQKMLNCAENILKELGLHYRVSLLAAQDCSFASSKTYDIEVWMPGQGVYKEVSSCSNCTDFQSRRSSIRFKELQNSPTKLVHTLNCSSLALPRLMVALMETYQDEKGNINLPEVLKPYGIF